jgi:predicted ester cyclase
VNDSVIELNKRVVRRVLDEVWSQGRTQVIGELVHSNFYRHHERNPDDDLHGLDGFRAWVGDVRGAIPDLALSPEVILAENDRVMVHARAEGTHGGALKGVAGTNTRIITTITTLLRLTDGKIVECWVVADTLGILQQVGALAPLGGGGEG